MAGSPELKTPQHIGFIMDGNRRWAKSLKRPISMGHKKGLEALEKVIEVAGKMGIKYLTFFSFSTENWSREKTEVKALMEIMAKALKEKGEVLHKKGAKIRVIGRIEDLSQKLQKDILELENLTKENKAINLIFAISYGGRTEIVDAVNSLKNKKEITEADISKNLYAPEIPEPELIIRTGGVKRLSGFLLWQSSYSELYFTNILWPDFDIKELNKALLFYSKTQRNFGK